ATARLRRRGQTLYNCRALVADFSSVPRGEGVRPFTNREGRGGQTLYKRSEQVEQLGDAADDRVGAANGRDVAELERPADPARDEHRAGAAHAAEPDVHRQVVPDHR